MREVNQIEQRFINNLAEYVRSEALQKEEAEIETYSDLKDKLSAVCMLELEIQYPLGIYIIDFYLWDELTNQKYAIEIDGHEAHKTKEQRFNDYRRERFLMREGFKVIRFMGSEVYTDALGCVKELMKLIDNDRKHYQGLERAFFVDANLAHILTRSEFNEMRNDKKYFRRFLEDIQIAYDLYSPYQFAGIEASFDMLGLSWKDFVKKR